MDDLAAFLPPRLDEVEADARAAQDERAPATGEHWHWEFTGGYGGMPHDGVTDETVDLAACADLEFVNEAGNWSPVSLRSVEQYPHGSIPGAGPHIALHGEEELPPGLARHIARHDPARVLADCAAKRAIVEAYVVADAHAHYGDFDAGLTEGLRTAVLHLARVHADHPDYRDEWRQAAHPNSVSDAV